MNKWSMETWMPAIAEQDGAVYDGKLFCLNHKAQCLVYDLTEKKLLGKYMLDKSDVMNPHANAVCFSSTYYVESDRYPLLYVNVYNNYRSAEDRMEGTCCVYRITETDGDFAFQLVQVLRIEFVDNLDLWKSKADNSDVRPYGNFVVDTDHGELYAFVMRDANRTTRVFRFRLPQLSEGTYSERYGCNVFMLGKGDILDHFDTPYMNYMQGCCYWDSKILSVEGFGAGSNAEPVLRIIDLRDKAETRVINLAECQLNKEPELIYVDNGITYYAAEDGYLRILNLCE